MWRKLVREKITIRHAKKVYGNTVIIPDLNLEINEGEFFTLLGPSGCGKTTLLRMIAGFNTIEGGEFYFNDKLINTLDPAKRNIGMVFQNYAIFPHLSVRKNVEFGLRNKQIDKQSIRIKAEEYLKLMQIENLADRMPAQLSGGQQQRVALARALCIEPHVLLMDEPLSNLDAKLRVEMRAVIKDIQHRVGITTVYVTHDQEEAMAISDRIAVMKDGMIQHVGTPKNIYQRPANIFVSTFIGRSNIFNGTMRMDGDIPKVTIYDYEFEAPGIEKGYQSIEFVNVSVRPEELTIHSDDGEGIPAVVDDRVFLGLNTHYFMHLPDGMSVEVIEESSLENTCKIGDSVRLTVNARRINIFAQDTALNIVEGVENDVPTEV